MWYSINFKDNLISVKNNTTDEVYITVSINESCNDVFEEVIPKSLVDFEEQFKLPLRDGLYRVVVDRVIDNFLIETDEYIYPYYGELLNTIIEETQYFLCGCECENCDDNCNKNEKTYLSLILKMFSYYTLLHSYYPRFYETIFKCLRCSILDINKCILINEKVIGESQNEELFKKLVSSLYTAFYLAEYYNTDDKEYIDNKFKFDKIKKCILVTNTDMECITKQIENNMGIFQVTFDRYDNKPPTEVGDYSTGAGNRAVLTINPNMFTSLTTPVYADPENDAAQAVRIDSLATNGAVLKLGGTPVTVGQVILMTTIASGTLTLEGPNQDAVAVSTFTFSVRDVGSMQFTS